jgi:hypothetical protein
MQAFNHQENLQLYLEHDAGYQDLDISQEDIDGVARVKLIFNGGDRDGLEGCFYITVDTTYSLNLSPGQQKLYEILVALQEGSVYAVTTIGKLAKAMGLENPLSASQRLENLRLLGAISQRKA